MQFGNQAFPLDPIPRLISAAEWGPLAAGLSQRARALGAFLADAYGERRIVTAGVMPASVIETRRPLRALDAGGGDPARRPS